MRSATILVLLLAVAVPGPIRAQANQVEPPPPRAEAAAAALFKLGPVAGSGRLMMGGWGGLVFGGRFLVGGGGMGLTRDVRIPGTGLSTGFDLGMGYGGLFLKVWEALPHRMTGGAGLFLGAGHAEVRDALLGREVGSDNFMVLEPELSLSYPVYRMISIEASGGYRRAWGVEDLPTVSSDDINAFSATLSVRLGGR